MYWGVIALLGPLGHEDSAKILGGGSEFMILLTLPSRWVHDGWWCHNCASQVRSSIELRNPVNRVPLHAGHHQEDGP